MPPRTRAVQACVSTAAGERGETAFCGGREGERTRAGASRHGKAELRREQ